MYCQRISVAWRTASTASASLSGVELPRGFHVLAGAAAGLGEPDQEVHVLGPRLLLDDVLQQKVARVRVRALSVHRRAPARELGDVLVVLARPRPELGSGQLAVAPL